METVKSRFETGFDLPSGKIIKAEASKDVDINNSLRKENQDSRVNAIICTSIAFIIHAFSLLAPK